MSEHDFEPVLLASGMSLRVAQPRGPSSGPLAVQLCRDDRAIDQAELPYPSAGLGGGRIIASPSGGYAVLAMFSGQSEERYELFKIEGETIARIGGLEYEFGENASYCFSSDETLLAMALPLTCIEWWSLYDEGLQPEGAGRVSFWFGQVRMHDIRTGGISVHELRVSVPEDWEPTATAYDSDLKPCFTTPHRLALSMPWGQVDLDLPLPATIVLPLRS